jgi:hypothetical protein
MSARTVLICSGLLVLSGCASVAMEDTEASARTKQVNPPSPGQAGLYIYRSAGLGTALKKDVWLDDKFIGETAPNAFFYEEVAGDREHTISTESEFSPNSLKLAMKAGVNYFVRQYIKLGVFVGGAAVEVVGEAEGKKDIQSLDLAKKGTCSK